MNNLYRPACLTAAYAPLPKHLSIQPRQVMPSVNHEWLEKANAEADSYEYTEQDAAWDAFQDQVNAQEAGWVMTEEEVTTYKNYDAACIDIPF